MIELILLLQADLDIQKAYERCEDFQPGRGELFLRHLDAAFTLLRIQPEMAPVFAGSFRRWLLREFPYGIFYQIQPNRIIVAAIIDLRQEPRAIRRKLFGKEDSPP